MNITIHLYLSKASFVVFLTLNYTILEQEQKLKHFSRNDTVLLCNKIRKTIMINLGITLGTCISQIPYKDMRVCVHIYSVYCPK